MTERALMIPTCLFLLTSFYFVIYRYHFAITHTLEMPDTLHLLPWIELISYVIYHVMIRSVLNILTSEAEAGAAKPNGLSRSACTLLRMFRQQTLDTPRLSIHRYLKRNTRNLPC